MQTIFTLNKYKNSGLFPLVVKAYDDSPIDVISSGALHYRNLLWRFTSHDEVEVSVFHMVGRLPDPLKYASFEAIYIYDFVHDAPFEEGAYRYLSAEARVSVQSPGADCVYELIIQGDRLAEVNELYRRLVSGNLFPYERSI